MTAVIKKPAGSAGGLFCPSNSQLFFRFTDVPLAAMTGSARGTLTVSLVAALTGFMGKVLAKICNLAGAVPVTFRTRE